MDQTSGLDFSKEKKVAHSLISVDHLGKQSSPPSLSQAQESLLLNPKTMFQSATTMQSSDLKSNQQKAQFLVGSSESIERDKKETSIAAKKVFFSFLFLWGKRSEIGSERLAWFLNKEEQQKSAQYNQRRSCGEIVITSNPPLPHKKKNISANTRTASNLERSSLF